MDDIDELLDEILVDAYRDAEQLTVFEVESPSEPAFPFRRRSWEPLWTSSGSSSRGTRGAA